VSQDQLLLALIAILVIANVVLMGSIPVRAHLDRRRERRLERQLQQRAVGAPSRSVGRNDDRGSDEDDRAAAAIEAFVEQLSPVAARQPNPPEPLRVAPGPLLVPPIRLEPVVAAAPDDDRRAPTVSESARRPAEPTWSPAELADRATWDRAIRDESARAARFGRPTTVVIAELNQLDDLAERLGPDVADRLVTETVRLLVSEGRAADRIAWLGHARFGVLLVETDERAARAYIERVRSATDRWFASAGLSIRLSVGWASPMDDGDVAAAAATAQQRMSVNGRLGPQPSRPTPLARPG